MFYRKFGAGDEKYLWTAHARLKMRQYGLSEGRVKRIIRFPTRYEEGIAPKTVAVMQPAGTKRYQEIWAMYKLAKRGDAKSIKIITAWRYPGKSPLRDPIPQEILREIKQLL
ncbi:MAG: DUF4258 domain-containing protein [Minisyncoccia bacterium]|jgi:hypothetical protein